jgi:hypothetical protein
MKSILLLAAVCGGVFAQSGPVMPPPRDAGLFIGDTRAFVGREAPAPEAVAAVEAIKRQRAYQAEKDALVLHQQKVIFWLATAVFCLVQLCGSLMLGLSLTPGSWLRKSLMNLLARPGSETWDHISRADLGGMRAAPRRAPRAYKQPLLDRLVRAAALLDRIPVF